MLFPYRMRLIKDMYSALTDVYDMQINKRLYPEEWEETTFDELEKEFETARKNLIEVLEEAVED